MALQTGQVINNRYRIVKLLGEGGFGAVYRAWDSNLNKPCAVKENKDTSPEAQRQFMREATVLANLSHPNLPRVTDHFILPNQGQYLVMDFVEGDDLASLIRQRGPVPVRQAVIWLSQVADALEYLHSRQPPVVHRDIKPANIRITPDGKAMLVDFGLVKVYNPQFKTTLGARAVTPGYAPPEQYGQGSTDARSDLYALGATLYNILTGQEPLESVQRMSGVPLRPVNQLNPSVPVGISQAIDRAMQLQPSQRFQKVGELKSALNSGSEPIIARPVGETYVVPGLRAPAVGPVTHPPVSKPIPKRSVGMWIGIGAVILVCLLGGVIGLGWMYSSSNKYVQETSDAEIQATLAERVRTTSTAQVIATSEARVEATKNAVLNVIETNSKLVYGPVSGTLEHIEGDSIIGEDSGVNLRDFIVEATFINPYDASENDWDYGFIVRHEAKNTQFRFVVSSDQTWVLFNNNNSPDGEVVVQGKIPELIIGANEANLIKLVFQGNRGWFFLNGNLISDLDLSTRMNSGNIFIVTGVFANSTIPGRATDYSDFAIYALP